MIIASVVLLVITDNESVWKRKIKIHSRSIYLESSFEKVIIFDCNKQKNTKMKKKTPDLM